MLEVRRPRRRLRQHLRRHVPAVRQGADALPARRSPTSTPSTLDEVERAITPATRMLFVETPTNPVMRLTDLRAAADLAHRHDAAARRRQHVREPVHPAADRVRRRPGHAQHDEVPQRPQRQRRRRRHRRARRRHRVAAVRAERRGRDPRPVRLVAGAARHQDAAAPDGSSTTPTAWRSPSSSSAHPKVEARLLSRACRRIRSTSWRGARCAASAGCSRSSSARSRRARRLLNGVRLMALAESLGGVETLISHPATMTHASVPAERRARDRHHRRPGPHLGGHRGHRRSEGRPRPGARPRSKLADSSISSSTSTSTCSSSSPTYGPWIYAILFVIIFAETGLVVIAVSAGRLAAVRGRRAVPRPARSSTPIAVGAADCRGRSPATR